MRAVALQPKTTGGAVSQRLSFPGIKLPAGTIRLAGSGHQPIRMQTFHVATVVSL